MVISSVLVASAGAKRPPKAFAVIRREYPAISEADGATTIQQTPKMIRGGAFDPTLNKALAGAATFAVIEQVVKKGLKAANLKYPAGLGACILLFSGLCIADLAVPETASAIFDMLSPGAAILAKWFPVFFVPGLALLPLSPSIGGTMDVSEGT